MTDDKLALLRTVCENPDADLPRLVYADWLDEHGDPNRAAFVRLQCELEVGDPFGTDRRGQEKQEWELLRLYGEKWIREDERADVIAPDSLWHATPKIRYRRGFVEHVWFRSPAEFLDIAPDLLSRAPITGVTLWAPYTIPPDEQQWFDNTYLTVDSRGMGLPAYLTNGPAGDEFPPPDEFRRFVHAPMLASIRSLTLDTIYLDRRHLGVLAASPLARQLRDLDLSCNCVIGEDWAALAESPALGGLQSLSLDRCTLQLAGLEALVNSSHLGRLQRLSLLGDSRIQPLGAEGVRLICESKALLQLRARTDREMDLILELICESKALLQLRELNLRGQGGGAAGLHALAAWPGFRRLTRLDVSFFYAEDSRDDFVRAWGDFARSPHWGQLRELDLEGDSLDALEAILGSPNVASLRILTFAAPFQRYVGDSDESLQDEAAAVLAGCPHLADNLQLRMPGRGLSEAAVRLLRDRFGDGLMLITENRIRQPCEWASGRTSQWMFDRP